MGTIDNICFYKLEGQYYARSKSTLDGRRVKKDMAFTKTMDHAKLLSTSSKIASEIYRTLSKEKKGRKIYQKIVGQVMQQLKEQQSEMTPVILNGGVVKELSYIKS